MTYKAGDRVRVLNYMPTLGLYSGDVGTVLAVHGSLLDLSVHFDKWDRGDRNWSDDASPHIVRLQAAFYMGKDEVKIIQTCMFNKGGDAT